MTPAEFKEGVGAYVMGALEPDEKKAFDEFLASGKADDECLRALERAERAAEAMNKSLPPVKPSPEVWASIEAEITMAEPRQTGGGSNVVPIFRNAIPWALAASMLVFTLLTQRQISMLRSEMDGLQKLAQASNIQLQTARGEQEYVVRMMHLEGTQTVRVGDGQSDNRMVFMMHKGVQECGIIASGMQPPQGKVYQLWFIADGKPIDAGVIPENTSGTIVMPVSWERMGENATAIAVTIEPAGGSRAPTTTPIMQGPL